MKFSVLVVCKNSFFLSSRRGRTTLVIDFRETPVPRVLTVAAEPARDRHSDR